MDADTNQPLYLPIVKNLSSVVLDDLETTEQGLFPIHSSAYLCNSYNHINNMKRKKTYLLPILWHK